MNIRLAHKNREVKPDSFEKLYGKVVDKLIRRKYPLSAELAILRQKDTKPEEFESYNAYVEDCKKEAKKALNY